MTNPPGRLALTRTIGATVCILGGLMLVAVAPAVGQTSQAPGFAAASDAYHEMSLKHYEAVSGLVWGPVLHGNTKISANSAKKAGSAQAPEAGKDTAAPPAAQEPQLSRLTGISIQTVDSGKGTTIDISTSRPTDYRVIHLENPDRLVLDLEGAINSTNRWRYSSHAPLLVRVRVGRFSPEDGGIIRVVADLRGHCAYRVDRGPSGFRIELTPKDTEPQQEKMHTVDAGVRSRKPIGAGKPAARQEVAQTTPHSPADHAVEKPAAYSPKLVAQRPAVGQTSQAPGFASASDAYHEMSLKHYEAAIEKFHEALAADPLNPDWRMDLAYAEVAAGSLENAARDFKTVYREHPEQLKIALELGYVYLQLHDNAAAQKYFAAAGSSVDSEISQPARLALQNLRASDLQSQKQKAYDLLDQGHRKAALGLFEQVHAADPSDSTVTMQLGYLYQATGKLAKAREMFETERYNQDPRVSGQATSALTEINHQSAWWFASAYVAPFYESRFANQINPINFKVGLRASRYLQPYLGMRFTRDIRSTSGTLPVIYSDNSDVFSVGLQSPILGHGTELYAEAGTAVSLMSRPIQGRAVPDYRAGISWYKPWETSLAEAAKKRSHGFSMTGNAYSDISFYSRYNDNIIGYLQIRQGLNLPTAHFLPMQVLAAINLVKDSNRDFYNNVLEAGPAVRIAPFRRLPDLQFEADYLRGVYTVHDPTNPYGPRYGDCRVFLIWSKDF